MFEELEKLLDGNESGLKLLVEAKEAQSSLTQRLNKLEVDSKKAFEARDGLKSQLNFVKSKFGLEELNDESLDNVLKGQGVEVVNLKKQLDDALNKSNQIESEYKSRLSDYALRSEIQKTGLAQKAVNGEMYSILENLVLSGASYEDGSIVYKNQDGSTKYVNGKQYTLSDKVAELESSEAYQNLFKADGLSGTGASKGGVASSTLSRGKMSHKEKGEYIAKYGQEAYFKLQK